MKIELNMLPELNPKSYDGAQVLEASGRPMLVIGRGSSERGRSRSRRYIRNVDMMKRIRRKKRIIIIIIAISNNIGNRRSICSVLGDWYFAFLFKSAFSLMW